ncbi:MAG: FKBP-type peptidyl-prolyl cis-trans isomerase [Candidatus Sedimenticola endophacoides]|uniref:Peptidyl-prolyl cis-trans isomerase n=1 Tax=Candidatus Sedimenticola endophacoides TaxID=2548426 RepID=A0A657PPT8_9GAMM|nr:MAG: peptidylprolyl isomerase [Candidatus Sedimenticola endophacoides]OQX37433.1 MAG: peptidylprolyl isomerase [Candidatus Sedimenticola endophacoides]OQX38107.1 MAG: peptidylprolyl isomerase [Candidatus Sedimenticola endophacoides]OQX39198.1 MAG: peptidylprolyl isomerase [Candidatus Sedimenticola endophacoides]OQX41235.1 MAG: peptidylprolyl isomerase [Candidatus Sedimenticola endophacoides]
MSQEVIQPGKFVSMTYTICDEEGNILEQNDVPVSYVHGGDTEMIGNMDRAVIGKCAGDEVQVSVPPEQGFGPSDPGLTFTDDIENVPPQFRQLGAEVPMQNEAGETRTFYVTRIEDGKLTVDGNHPLAGKTLVVRVKILEVRDARPEDMATPPSSCSIN